MILGTQQDPITMPSPKCGKCGGEMREGFIPDAERSSTGITIWVADKPEFSTFGSARANGKEAYEIRTFRCVKCGFLESYAIGRA